MPVNVLFRLSGWSAIISSVLCLLAAMIALVSIFVSGISDTAVTILMVIADLFIPFALIGFYGIQYTEVGRLGLIGFILAMLAIRLVFNLPPAGWWCFLIGLCLFAIASMRAAILPIWGMWLWFVGACTALAGSMANSMLLFALGLGIAAGGRAWLGIALLREKVEAPVPEPPERLVSMRKAMLRQD